MADFLPKFYTIKEPKSLLASWFAQLFLHVLRHMTSELGHHRSSSNAAGYAFFPLGSWHIRRAPSLEGVFERAAASYHFDYGVTTAAEMLLSENLVLKIEVTFECVCTNFVTKDGASVAGAA